MLNCQLCQRTNKKEVLINEKPVVDLETLLPKTPDEDFVIKTLTIKTLTAAIDGTVLGESE